MKYFMVAVLVWLFCVKTLMVKVPKMKGIEQDPSLLEWYDVRGVKMVKYNKSTLAITGKFIFKRRMANIQYSVKFARKIGSSYLPIPLVSVNEADYCSFLQNPHIRPLLEDLFNHTNLEFSCDHPPGEYIIENYVPQIPSELPPGDYRGEYSHHFEGECIGRVHFQLAWVDF